MLTETGEDQPGPFYSQFGEDRFLVTGGHVPKRGVFVDIGAGDPVRFSNTYFLEQHGWTGVCIDADPRQVDALTRSRRCGVEWAAVTSAGDVAELLLCDDPDYSTTLEHLVDVAASHGWGYAPTDVPALRLETLLAKHGIDRIDLLSIDTEGSELDVCGSMDWDRHRPSIVVIEHATLGRPPQDAAIHDYFAQLPYRLIHQTACNLIFARTRLPTPLRRRSSRRVLSRVAGGPS